MADYKFVPPPELVQQWRSEWIHNAPGDLDELGFLANCAAQWGADQELEACCEWVGAVEGKHGPRLRLARRPKPLSLQEQYVEQVHDCDSCCILELRARVEALEAKLPEEESTPEGEILDYYSRLAAQHPGKAVLHQDPSLAERVVMAITRDGEKARWDEARAAMLEIAKWLELRAGGTRACWLLEREAQR